MRVQRAYRFRIYPNAGQRQQLAIDFGCARWVWNKALDWRSREHRDLERKVTGVDFSRELTFLKALDTYAWLSEANSTVLVQALRDQDRAFRNFFAGRAKYPKFKKRRRRQSVRYQLDQRQGARRYAPGALLRLPKLGALKVRWSRVPTGTPKMVCVSRDALGRYFVAFMCEESIQPLPVLANAVGVDRGIKDLLVRSSGEKSGAPKYYRQYQRRLKLAQRVVSRRTKGSNRWHRARHRLARIHAKIAASREDYTHKATTKLVREAQVIALEDLNVRGMMRNHRLAKSIGDSAMHEVKRQIAYKAAWYGREVLYCGRWAPSSKACPDCAAVQPEMPLNIREWTCPDCGAHHDRDVAAARNVLLFATAGRAGSDARGAGQLPSAKADKPAA